LTTRASLFYYHLGNATEAQLYKAFSGESNTIISARVCKDSATGKSLCHGYVNLSSHQEGNNAFSVSLHCSGIFVFVYLI